MITHKGTVPLSTPRLVFRKFTVDDAQAMYSNWSTDKRVPEYLEWDVHESVEYTRELLTKWIAEYESPEYYHWTIEYEAAPIGTINLHAIANGQERCEVGYCIGSKWWNLGIMTEAVAEILRFAFMELGMNKVAALYDIQNAGSGRVLQKNGMKQEGLLREHALRRDGTRGDLVYCAILKHEWNG